MAKLKDTTITMVQGDSEELLLTMTDDADTPANLNLSVAVDGTASRPAVVRFAVKKDPAADANEDALIFKTSYDDEEIDTALAQPHQATLYIDSPDTAGIEAGTYRWDLEVTRQDFVRTSAGTISVSAGSTTVTGSGTSFLRANVGDVLQPLGTNTKPVIVTAIASDTSLTVESPVFQTEAGLAFELRRGYHRTSARGPFVIVEGVVD